MTQRPAVVVTRPGEAGRELVEALERAGQPALWLPAFEFGAAPDETAARAVLAELAGFDLAIFVSPQAARATGAMLTTSWPAATAIAAVGAGTTAEVLRAIDGASDATLVAPSENGAAQGSGSESLWPLLQALSPPPRRVLLLRAQGGREWLAERLQEIGATVVAVAVYSRVPFEPAAELTARLAAAAQVGLASVISSSEAVDALTAMLGSQAAVLQALRAGPALASHPRIAERLRAAGFGCVTICPPESGAVLSALRKGGG